MKILVVIPSHQRKELLGEALDSVAAQTHKPDIVVVTGDTRPGRGYRWVEFDYSTEILATRINRAVAYHECDAFVLLCDDDKLEPTII
jgi:GT2 family glycosyltransferase